MPAPTYPLPDQIAADMLDFCQRLVRLPSLSGQEELVAKEIEAEMIRLGYDEVTIDAWGNVIGLLHGGSGRPILFNGHMDVVDAGKVEQWPHPPFGGVIADGQLWGRGAADMKGALACMIHGVGSLARAGERPAGDVYVSAVVHEELGGFGTSRLSRSLHPACAVVGEASANQLARGHRGRVEVVASVKGRSVHASTPALGANPLQVIARFVLALERLPMASVPAFGASSVAPTVIYSDLRSANVIPGEVRLHLDWRTVPGENADDALAQLTPLLDAAVSQVPGCSGELLMDAQAMHTWTGLSEPFVAVFPSFETPADSPWLASATGILQSALGRTVDTVIWPFATDGGHLMAAGIPVIGFGPGESRTLHTVGEHVPVAMLREAMAGYAALARSLGALSHP